MLKKDITYENFDGKTVTETFFFHMSKAELLEFRTSKGEGFQAVLQNMIDTEDVHKILLLIREIVEKAVGRKSSDGNRFIKNDEIRQDFMNSEAYSELVIELGTDADKAGEFITGLAPKGLDETIAKLAKEQGVSIPSERISRPASSQPADPAEAAKGETYGDPAAPLLRPETKVLTRAEIIDMDSDELRSGLATGRYLIGPEDVAGAPQ